MGFPSILIFSLLSILQKATVISPHLSPNRQLTFPIVPGNYQQQRLQEKQEPKHELNKIPLELKQNGTPLTQRHFILELKILQVQ